MITRQWYEQQLAKQAAHKTRSKVSDTQQHEQPPALEGAGSGEAHSPGYFFVRFTLFRTALLDVDAKYTSVKDLLDCCVNSQLVVGDKEGQIHLEVRQTKVKSRKEEKTEIELS